MFKIKISSKITENNSMTVTDRPIYSSLSCNWGPLSSPTDYTSNYKSPCICSLANHLNPDISILLALPFPNLFFEQVLRSWTSINWNWKILNRILFLETISFYSTTPNDASINPSIIVASLRLTSGIPIVQLSVVTGQNHKPTK